MSQVFVFTDFGGPEMQRLIDRDVPEPGDDQVTIAVRAAGVNPADWKIREGMFGRKWRLPAPIGREAAGVIHAVGANVTDFAVGDAVLGPVAKGQGSFAEHAVLDSAKIVAKPATLSFADAGVLSVAGATAYDAAHQLDPKAGETMVILGAGGGLGLIVAQLAARQQVTVLGVASASKQALIEATGATFVLSGPGAADRIRQAAPRGVDLIVDLVGGDPLRDIASVVTDPARIVSTADPQTAEALGGVGIQRTAHGLAQITEVAAQGHLELNVEQRFALEDAAEAMAAVETGHAAGKVVIEM